MRNNTFDFDHTVGRIAGAIYSDISDLFPGPPLMLVPPLTFKVRKIMEQVTDLSLLSEHQKATLAKDMQIAIVPMLFSLEIDADVIEKITPAIEMAALKALSQPA
jgi:hypothetical protein